MKYILLIFLTLSNLVAQNHDLEPIRLGGIYSLSGFGSVGGQSEVNGALIAIEEINNAGGIGGRRIEFVFEDNQSKSNKTLTAFKKLTSLDKINYLIGPNWAEFAEILAPVANREKVPMITATGWTKALTKGKQYVFTMLPSHFEAISIYAEFILNAEPKKLAIIHTNNTFYDSITEGIEEYFSFKDQKVWKKFSFDPEEYDYRTIITKLKSENVDALVLFLAEGGVTASFLKQAKELGFPIEKIYAGPAVAYDEIILKDLSIAEGVNYFDYTDPSKKSFREKYKARYKVDSQVGTGKSYDSVFLLKKAIEECGFKAQEVITCLKNIEYNGVSGYIKFKESGDFAGSAKLVDIYRIINGKAKHIG